MSWTSIANKMLLVYSFCIMFWQAQPHTAAEYFEEIEANSERNPPTHYDLLLSNVLYTQFWSSSRAKRAGLYTTPASALSFASLRCRSSKNLLFSVAKSMLLLANPSVTFCHILRDSVGSWLGTVCTNLGCFLHVPASNITSLLPVCCVLMFIFPFQSPSNEYTLFFWFGANTWGWKVSLHWCNSWINFFQKTYLAPNYYTQSLSQAAIF